MRAIAALLSATILAVTAVPLSAQVDESDPASSPAATDAIAAAVRIKGYSCQTPAVISPDFAAGTRLEPVWLVNCGGDRYRVIFVGDTGPLVEPLN
jgi:hypothetical protein